jgi:hypothetical protein
VYFWSRYGTGTWRKSVPEPEKILTVPPHFLKCIFLGPNRFDWCWDLHCCVAEWDTSWCNPLVPGTVEHCHQSSDDRLQVLVLFKRSVSWVLYRFCRIILISDFSVADPDPGSGAFLTPGSGIRNRIFPDPWSRIPDPKPKVLVMFNIFDICGYTKRYDKKNFCSPLSFVAVFGSGIRDPWSGMGKNQDPG